MDINKKNLLEEGFYLYNFDKIIDDHGWECFNLDDGYLTVRLYPCRSGYDVVILNSKQDNLIDHKCTNINFDKGWIIGKKVQALKKALNIADTLYRDIYAKLNYQQKQNELIKFQ